MTGGFFSDTDSITEAVQSAPNAVPETQPAEQTPGGLFTDNVAVTNAVPEATEVSTQDEERSPGGYFADSVSVTPIAEVDSVAVIPTGQTANQSTPGGYFGLLFDLLE